MLQALFSPKLWGKGPKHPVGPSFSDAYERKKDLSGNLVSFKAPAPCGDAGLVSTDEEYGDSVDISDPNGFNDLKKTGATANYYCGDALVKTVFLSSWQLNGRPLLDGYMGDVMMDISVRYLPDLSVTESLFHPEVLAREVRRESELGYLCDFHNGYNEDEWDFTNTRWPHNLGPLNWQWQKLNGQQWLYYEMQSLRGSPCPYIWNIALTDNLFLECAFYVTKSGWSGGNSYCREVTIASEPYLKLMHQIMSTLTLTRTPELAAREQQVLTEHPDARLLLHPGPSAEELALAARVMWKWSASDMRIEKQEGVDYRARPEAVAELIKRRIQPQPLSGYIDSAVFADDFPAGRMFAGGTKFERGN
jgi:hypothetical protein